MCFCLNIATGEIKEKTANGKDLKVINRIEKLISKKHCKCNILNPCKECYINNIG